MKDKDQVNPGPHSQSHNVCAGKSGTPTTAVGFEQLTPKFTVGPAHPKSVISYLFKTDNH